MTPSFEEVKLGDYATIQTGPFGSQLHQSDYVQTGTPIITVEHLGENWITHKDLPLVSDHDRERLKKYSLQKGDIVFSRVGSVDRRALVRDPEDGWLFSGRCLRVRTNQLELNSEFLSFFFGSPRFKYLIRSIAVGATMPSINTKILSDVIVPKPALNEQQTIAEILSSLDEKIELNRKQNQTLEVIAQTLFKRWFVEFEFPDENGNSYKSSGGAMQPSELGEIPAGWELKQSGDLIDVRDGTHDSPKKSETGFPLVTSKHITTGELDLSDTYLISDQEFEKVNKRSLVSPGDILLTMIGTVGIPYLVMQNEVNFAIKNIGLFRTSESEELRYFWFLLLKSRLMQHELHAQVAGTTQRYLSLRVLRSINFVLPPPTVLSAFNKIIDPIMNKISQGFSENETLNEIRGRLLPKLMSGELRVA